MGQEVDCPDPQFADLVAFLARIPPMRTNDSPRQGFSYAMEPKGWWIKFVLDIAHPLAWAAVQELGHVLNYLSITDRLPTVFKPVSPPPYLNGGPHEYLGWVIECSPELSPSALAKWLEGRLPRPVEDVTQWPG